MRPGLILLALLLAGIPPVGTAQTIKPSAASGEWVVVMHDPRSARRRSQVGGAQYSPGASYADDPQLDRAAKRLTRDFDVPLVTQWPIKSLNVHCIVIRIPDDVAADELVDALKADHRVKSVQPMHKFATESSADPYRQLQPALKQLQITPAHLHATGRGVTISVIDSGVDADHPDLKNAIDLTENFVDSDTTALAEQHGTGIAGVIAASTNNGLGVSGIAPDAKIQALRACWQGDGPTSKAHCNTLTLSRALDRAIELQPSILNLSLSGPADPLLEELLDILLGQGTLVVAAYDEHRGMDGRFPSARPGVLYGRNVSASDGQSSDDCFPAPGTDVLTVQPGSGYGVLNGNSLSAAHISGTVALLLQEHPGLDSRAVTDALQTSLVDQTETASINACLALRSLDARMDCTIDSGG